MLKHVEIGPGRRLAYHFRRIHHQLFFLLRIPLFLFIFFLFFSPLLWPVSWYPFSIKIPMINQSFQFDSGRPVPR